MYRILMKLALPLAAAQAGNQVMGLVDAAIVGHLGAVELAAVGLGNNIFFTIAIIGMGLMMGFDPLISQAVGAGDEAAARRLFRRSVSLAVITTAVLAVPIALIPTILGGAGVDAATAAETRTYVLWRLPSLLPLLILMSARSYLQAHKNTRPLITSVAIANAVNLALGVPLTFGFTTPGWAGSVEILPALGVAGAGITTMLATFVQLAVLLSAMSETRSTAFAGGLRSWLDPRGLVPVIKVGLPIGLQMLAEMGVFAIVGLLAVRFGPAALAAHQVALALGHFSFSIAQGIAAAGSVHVGRSVGAEDHAGTRGFGFAAFASGAAIMTVMASFFWLAPDLLAGLLTDDSDIISVAVDLLLITAVFQVFDGVQAVGSSVLRGAGDTRFPLLANLVGYYALGLPTALFLGFGMGMGVIGLWIGLCVGLISVAAVLLVRFARISGRPIARLQPALAGAWA